ncbi:hypothetical protein [Vulcanisaeta souniana]|uniref:hypothetical protein n=1 Tax=Vulcanisaeta souniana TaxID=164452 RepID=UPI001FB38978|nr:hypothetical protein [Vulcanisaeta souniana]
MDILDSEVEVSPPVNVSSIGVEKSVADGNVAREVAKLLADAEFPPVLLLGRGVLLSGLGNWRLRLLRP